MRSQTLSGALVAPYREPVETPWHSLTSRLEPADLQLSLASQIYE